MLPYGIVYCTFIVLCAAAAGRLDLAAAARLCHKALMGFRTLLTSERHSCSGKSAQVESVSVVNT
eukprot:COSAG01_NODE_1271_length_10961_cov_555.935739_2_plen_65_part_00